MNYNTIKEKKKKKKKIDQLNLLTESSMREKRGQFFFVVFEKNH